MIIKKDKTKIMYTRKMEQQKLPNKGKSPRNGKSGK